MRSTVVILSLVFVIMAAGYFTVNPQTVSGQPVNVHAILNDHMKSFERINNLAQLPITMVEKVIPTGSDVVAFNPNHGNSKVITVLAPTD